MATPVFLKHMHIAFLAILMWVLNVLAATHSQDKTEETLNLAVAALGDLNEDTISDDEILEELSSKGQRKSASTTDEINANVSNISDPTSSDLENISKEMAQMDLSFQERVVTKDSSCDFVSREEDDDDAFEIDTCSQEGSDIIVDGQNTTISEEDEDVTVLKVDRHVENRVFEIQNSKPKKYKPEELAKKKLEDEEAEEGDERPVEQQSAAKVLIECTKCKRSFGLDIISQHIQFCQTGGAEGNVSEEKFTPPQL